MLRADLQWHFPETLEEAVSLLSGRQVVPHAGGTGLLRARPPGTRGLVDLARLPMHTIREEGSELRLGAMLTFADLASPGPGGAERRPGKGARMDVQAPPGPERRMLARALLQAASTPLRHRITLGGSVADSPAWSDLAAPLLCLQAEVVLLARDGERRLPYEEYLADRGRRTAHLVREVVVKRGSVSVFALARLAMVRFDYAACHLAMAARLEDGRLADPRIWVTGARGRAVRLTAAEQAVAGSRPDEAAARRAAERAEAAFVSDPRFSAAYKGRWTRIQVRDGLLQMGEEAHG